MVEVFGSGSLGLFTCNEMGECRPNAASVALDDCIGAFRFAGRILAKAIATNITLDVSFAYFFLAKILKEPTMCKYAKPTRNHART